MLSNIPPVFPILKQPGLIPPTCRHTQSHYNRLLNKAKHCVDVYGGGYYCGWSNDGDSQSVRLLDQFLCLVFWNSLCYDGHRAELQEVEENKARTSAMSKPVPKSLPYPIRHSYTIFQNFNILLYHPLEQWYAHNLSLPISL